MAISRRSVLRGALGTGLLASRGALSAEDRRPRIAAVVTEYRENSHADVIVGKFLEGCRTPEITFTPKVEVVSLYLDQEPASDLGREVAARHGAKLFPTIGGALTLGGKELAVDGVLLIGEHGRYPYNDLDQHLYPRRRFFEETAGVFRKSGRSVPVFTDKHLGPVWADARWMYDTAQELKVPFMAGSSLPVTWRRPEPDLPVSSEMTELVAVGYGPTEAYGFHALEMAQYLAERRKGGEVGVKRVQHLTGEAVWAAAAQSRWSERLMMEALSRSERPAVRTATRDQLRQRVTEPECFLLEYRDGFRSAVLMLPGFADEFMVAARLKDQSKPISSLFWLQDGKPFIHFARLCEKIQEMFLTGKAPYPVERTLLTSGILDAVMRSRQQKGAALDTPELGIAYRP